MSNLPPKGLVGLYSHRVSGGMVKIAYQDYLKQIKGDGLHVRDLLHEGKVVTYRVALKDYKLEPIDDLTVKLIPELTTTRDNEAVVLGSDIRWLEREALKKLSARLENRCGFKIREIGIKEEEGRQILVLRLFQYEV